MSEKKKMLIMVLIFVLFFVIALLLYNFAMKSNKNLLDQNTNAGNYIDKYGFEVIDNDGVVKKLSEYKGKPIVINFWATWCIYCEKEMPYFNTAYNEHKEDVEFLMINVMELENVANEFVNKNGYDFEIVFDKDGSVSNKLNITGFPTTIFIDKEGNLLKRQGGMISENELKTNIDKLLIK